MENQNSLHNQNWQRAGAGLIPLLVVSVCLWILAAPPACGEALPTEEHVTFAVNAELVKGHLLVSRELYATGHQSLAAKHAGHPIEELWSLLHGPLNQASAELASRIGALLETVRRKVDARIPVQQYEASIEAVFAAMDEAGSEVVPASVRDSAAFRAGVVGEVIQHVEEEYAEGVKGGKVVRVVEYQDAYGFFRRTQALYASMAGQLRLQQPKAAKEIEGSLATLAKGFVRAMPTGSPLSVAKVREEVREIVAELGKAAGVQLAARASAAEEIRSVRSTIQEGLDAYRRGDLAGTERLVTSAYLEHFEKAEEPLERKDKALEKRLEQLIRNDLRGKIKAKAPVAEVEELIRTIIAALDQAEQRLAGQ